MDQYISKSTSELRKKLREYGYRGYTNMNKEQLSKSAFIVDMEQKIVKKFKPSPINYSQFAIGRCNAFRHQRFVSESDMSILKTMIFKEIKDDLDFKENDVKEYIWVAVYTKSETDDIYIHCLLQLYNGYYYYFDTKLDRDNKLIYKIAKDKSHKNLVNNIMTNEQYYWYRYGTELQYQIDLVRDLKPRVSPNLKSKIDDISYLYYKLKEYKSTSVPKIIKIQNSEKLHFDFLENVKKLFWVHLNYTSNDRSYLIYQNSDNNYILIKFSFELKIVEEIPQCNIKMVKVYLSENYSELIQKSLVNKDYEMYINETSEIR
jgi:hypothetical protein